MQQLAHVAGHELQRLLPGVQPRQAEQILDETLHPPRVRHEDLEEPAPVVGVDIRFADRLEVPAHRGQRRPQLVRDVGDEIAPDLIGAAEIGDVVQHHDDAARAAAGIRWRGARRQDPRRIARRRQLHERRRAAGERLGDQRLDRRVPDDLDVMAADRQVVEPQHLPGRVVGELEPALRIDDDDALDHPGQDGRRSSAVARQLRDPHGEVGDGLVERPGDGAELVVAVLEPARGEVAVTVAPRRIGDAAHPMSEPPRDHECHHDRGGQCQAERRQRRDENRLRLVAGVGERKRQADERDLRVADARRDVQHVDAERRAVPLGASDAVGGGRRDFRTRQVILEVGQRVDRLRGIAQHPSVRGNQRHPRGDQLAHPVGFGVRLIDPGGRLQELRGQFRFLDERLLEPLVGLPPRRLRHQQPRDNQRDGRGRQRDQEQLQLK